MMFNLNEDNQSVEDLVKYIESKILQLKKENKLDDDSVKEIEKVYNNWVNPWMSNYYMSNIEPKSNRETQIINNLLELISYLNKIYCRHNY